MYHSEKKKKTKGKIDRRQPVKSNIGFIFKCCIFSMSNAIEEINGNLFSDRAVHITQYLRRYRIVISSFCNMMYKTVCYISYSDIVFNYTSLSWEADNLSF